VRLRLPTRWAALPTRCPVVVHCPRRRRRCRGRDQRRRNTARLCLPASDATSFHTLQPSAELPLSRRWPLADRSRGTVSLQAPDACPGLLEQRIAGPAARPAIHAYVRLRQVSISGFSRAGYPLQLLGKQLQRRQHRHYVTYTAGTLGAALCGDTCATARLANYFRCRSLATCTHELEAAPIRSGPRSDPCRSSGPRLSCAETRNANLGQATEGAEAA
jgi:hypothetical protein